ncbi:MAG TPA: class I SAM-dependent methyltransferase [Bacteroidales bacterium]|nr:class I SAM-dependent methyltransferase [Bacteroidales bacterium]HPM92255.1 class I SAM-dependent methyltransferase [Bacteroidales bacterium]
MNNSSTPGLWRTGRFLEFLFRSGTRYRVHSPFLYGLITEVIRKNSNIPDERPILDLKKRLWSSSETILKTDYGSGSGKDGEEPGIYPVSLRKLVSGSVSSSRKALRFYRLIRYSNFNSILEIGTSIGLTTAYFSKANPSARIITLEGCPELSRIAVENWKKLGLGNISISVGRFEDTLAPALESLGKADFILVDGNHRKEATIRYFEICLPFMNNDSVMVLDDIHASRGMEEAWEHIVTRPEVKVSLDLFYSGWLFFRKESSKEHFKLRYF